VYSTFRFWLFAIAVVLILLSATRRESLFINIAIFKFTVHLETVVLHLFRLPFSPASVSISLLTYDATFYLYAQSVFYLFCFFAQFSMLSKHKTKRNIQTAGKLKCLPSNGH